MSDELGIMFVITVLGLALWKVVDLIAWCVVHIRFV